jgi:hypothetical protein
MSQGLNGIGGVGNANTWSQTQSFLPYYYPYQSAIRILVGQTSPNNASILAHYSSPDAAGLGIGDYPLLQVTYGTSLYLGIQAGNSELGNEYLANIGIGYNALFSNTDGYSNVSIGYDALYYNTSGDNNIGIGYGALYKNTSGVDNIAIGTDSLPANTTGYQNIAIGYESGYETTIGYENISIGFYAGGTLTTGNNNIAIGYYSGDTNQSGQYTVQIGTYASSSKTGTDNTIIGNYAGYNYLNAESNNIIIGENYGTSNDNAMLRIGNPNSQVASPTGQIAFSLMNLKGFGLSPIYGMDNRHGLTSADASPNTLYVTTASNQLYKLTARIMATAGTSPSAEYVIKWIEGGATITKTLQISAIDSDADLSTILIQPDSGTIITTQLTAISGTGTTVNVASTVEEVA